MKGANAREMSKGAHGQSDTKAKKKAHGQRGTIATRHMGKGYYGKVAQEGGCAREGGLKESGHDGRVAQ